MAIPLNLPAQAELRAAFALHDDALSLDSASNGPRLRAVLAAGHAALDDSIAPWLQSYADWRMQIERVRAQAARLFEGDADGVALVPSAAFGLSLAARILPLHAGDAVLVLAGQFPSNLLPWQRRCAEVDARIVAVGDDGRDWTAAVLAALAADPAIRVLALPQAYWHDGRLLDLARIADAARVRGIALVLDLSQSLGALPVELADWQPDFVVGVGHKWLLGPHGLAYCWAAPRWRTTDASLDDHWQARDDGDRWQFDSAQPPPYRTGARRFDAGGICDPARLAMAEAALAQVLDWGVPMIAAGLRERIARFVAALHGHGLDDWLPRGEVAHFVGLRPPPDLLQPVAAALAAAGVVLTARHGLLRIAPHLHVAPEELEQVAAAIAAAARPHNRLP